MAIVTRQQTESEAPAYKRYPEGCRCASPRISELHSKYACSWCQEVARQQALREERISDQ